MSTHRPLALAAALACAASAAHAGVSLTDVFQFSTSPTGQPAGGQLWDTNGGNSFTIWLSANGSPINGIAPDTGNPSITYDLTPGSHSFQMWGQVGSAGAIPHAGMNLFFGGDSAPSISVFAAARGDMGPPPPIAANSDPGTFGPAGTTPGSGTLSYFDAGSGLTVTLVDYFYANPQVFDDDSVQGRDRTPGRGADYYGEFTLRVVPAPASAAMLGVFGVTAARRRR